MSKTVKDLVCIGWTFCEGRTWLEEREVTVWDREEEVLDSSLGFMFKSETVLECALVTEFGSAFEKGDDVTFWELGNSVLRDIKGSTLTEVELASACWEERVGSLGEGETRGI